MAIEYIDREKAKRQVKAQGETIVAVGGDHKTITRLLIPQGQRLEAVVIAPFCKEHCRMGANAMDQRDLLIKNGKILCMDGDVRADWLLTQGGKIARLGVGKRDPEYISGTVQIIDAGGRTVLPGFIDNHFQPSSRFSA